MGCQTSGLLGQWVVKTVGCWVNGLSKQWVVGSMGCQTSGLLDQWAVREWHGAPSVYTFTVFTSGNLGCLVVIFKHKLEL